MNPTALVIFNCAHINVSFPILVKKNNLVVTDYMVKIHAAIKDWNEF